MRQGHIVSANKSISIEDFWGHLEGAGAKVTNLAANTLYGSNAWYFRCIRMRATAVASIPFKIFRGKEEAPNPFVRYRDGRALGPLDLKTLLSYTESFLSLCGACYWLKLANTRKTVGLQILNPASMKAVIDDTKGLTGFTQRVRGVPKPYTVDQIVYFRSFNPTNDLGPGVAPGQVARKAASVVDAMNTYAAGYFDSGAVPALILWSEKQVPDLEMKRIAAVWKKFLRNVRNAWSTIVLRSGLKPEIIGAHIKDLAMPQLTRQSKSQIAGAFGVPQALLEDVSNRATASVHRLSFWTETVIPEAELIQSVMNEQLFEPMGLRFEFQFQDVEALQQDESTKATANAALIDRVTTAYEKGLIERDEARQNVSALLRQCSLPGVE